MQRANGLAAAGGGNSVESFLRVLVAEESRLRETTRQFYHSVRGPHFHSLQKLFEDQGRQLECGLSRLKARGEALGGANTTEAWDDDNRRDSHVYTVSAAHAAGALITWHEQLAACLHADTHLRGKTRGDPATAEILDHMARFHETSAWILRLALDGRDASV